MALKKKPSGVTNIKGMVIVTLILIVILCIYKFLI